MRPSLVLRVPTLEEEPEVLPTRIPNLLINGSAGIAVGMATNIAPHNLGEIVDACQLLLRRPEASYAAYRVLGLAPIELDETISEQVEIAAKYAGDDKAREMLARRVKAGSSGVWGTSAMPPHAAVPDADIALLVNWILSRR